jgi:predicted nucleotidyltransferase
MQTHTDLLDMIAQVMRDNRSRLAGYRVFLFGSRAAGRTRPRSDYDIGVIGPAALPARDFFAIEDELDALPTLHKIDWVDFNRVTPRFRERVVKQSIDIFNGGAD